MTSQTMSSRPPERARGRGVVIVTAVLIATLVAGTVMARAKLRDRTYRYLSVFAEVLHLVDGNYVDSVEVGDLMSHAYQGMVGSLDPYSGYLTRSEYQEVVNRLRKEATPGLVVAGGNGRSRIISLIPAGPAEQAGVIVGDYLRSIDGKSTREMSLLEVRAALHGPADSSVVLGLIRKEGSQREEITVTRRVLAEGGVRSTFVSPDAGVVHLPDFSSRSVARLREELRHLRRKEIRYLVLDLRDNNDLEVDNACDVASVFVRTDSLAVLERRGEEDVTLTADRGKVLWPEDAPLAILVNSNTARSAELVTSALRKHRAASVVGEKTVGSDRVQEFIELPSRDYVLLSVGRVHLGEGTGWDEGIEPDGTPDSEETLTPAEELDWAVEWLRTLDAEPAQGQAA